MGSYKEIKHLRVLIPTLREKKRYILLEFLKTKDKKPVDRKTVKNEIEKTILKVLGCVGMGYLSFNFVKSRKLNENQLLIRVNNLSVPFLLSSLVFVNNLRKQGIVVKVVGISGTIKSLFE